MLLQMINSLSPSRLALLVLITWLAWRAAPYLLVKSPLDNIPGPKPTSYWKGNLPQIFAKDAFEYHKSIGEAYGSVVRITGLFGQRILYVIDPTAMHNIVIKDQNKYQPPRWLTEIVKLGFGPGLLAVYGETHRKQRKMLNPVFSVNHLRHMSPTFYNIAHKLRDAIAVQVKQSPKDVDMLRWVGRTALEVIGQGGLGYSFDPLVENKPNPYGDAMKNFLPTVFRYPMFRMFVQYARYFGSASFHRRLVELVPLPLVQKLKDTIDTMQYRSVEIFKLKKQALVAGNEVAAEELAEGKDIISVLLRENMEVAEQDKLPEEELLGQMATLVFAATDTMSATLSQILSLLSEHEEVQEKLRQEILDSKQGTEDIPYDALMDRLPYLDAICRETLRLYPPITVSNREAVEDTILPLSKPIIGLDGKRISEIPIPKGTGFLAVTNAKVPAVYSNVMTFLGGGRACIGFKYAQLEMKIVLSVLLESFKFTPAECAKDIRWNLAGVKYPSVGNVDIPSLPIKVELLSR
ncbi:Cytochrome P450 superfamily protein [Abortiporus biennis]